MPQQESTVSVLLKKLGRTVALFDVAERLIWNEGDMEDVREILSAADTEDSPSRDAALRARYAAGWKQGFEAGQQVEIGRAFARVERLRQWLAEEERWYGKCEEALREAPPPPPPPAAETITYWLQNPDTGAKVLLARDLAGKGDADGAPVREIPALELLKRKVRDIQATARVTHSRLDGHHRALYDHLAPEVDRLKNRSGSLEEEVLRLKHELVAAEKALGEEIRLLKDRVAYLEARP